MSFNINTVDDEIVQAFGENAQGKTVLITGPSRSGIGAQVAAKLAEAKPALLILAGRNEAKIKPVAEEIEKTCPGVKTAFVPLNLLSTASIRDAIKMIRDLAPTVDLLINNAGVMATRQFLLSEDGVESQFAANYLGHFLLTNLLLKEQLIKSGGTILNVGSLGYQMADIDFGDINFKNGECYNGWKAYGQAKSAQLLGTRGLANRLKDKNISVLIAHPGVTIESQLLANSAIDQEYFGEAFALAIERNDGNPLPPQNMVSLKQAAGVVLWSALNPALRAKHAPFIVENEIYTETRDYANNDTDADKLWELSEQLVKEAFEF